MGPFQPTKIPWKFLHGVFCIYKPPFMPIEKVKHKIITNLERGLNESHGTEEETSQRVVIEGWFIVNTVHDNLLNMILEMCKSYIFFLS